MYIAIEKVPYMLESMNKITVKNAHLINEKFIKPLNVSILRKIKYFYVYIEITSLLYTAVISTLFSHI